MLFNKTLAVSFLTGFVISLFLYVLLRLACAKWVFNMLTPVMMTFSLLGVAAGAMLNARLREKSFARLEPWLFAAALVFFACVAYNRHLAMTYLIPVNGFSLYSPENIGFHLAAEVIFFLLAPVIFLLPGYYFAGRFHRAESPYAASAAHTLGFLCGGPAGLALTVRIGPETGLFAGVCVLLMFMLRRRPAVTLLLLAAAGGIFAYSFRAPRLFFTWSQREYKLLESTWSPYFKLDFISFNDDHCIAGVYNNVFLYYTCDTPDKAHLQVRQIYKELAKGKKNILVIGGSLGTALSYMTVFQDQMERAVSVEVDPVVAERSTGRYGHYSGFALNRADVEVVASEGRVFLEKDRRMYDLIFLDGLDNRLFFAPMSLVAIENYMFTREGLAAVFDRLSPRGVVTVDMGGTTAVEYIAPFLSALPGDVDYELFWYVVPDRPMIGLPLYFIVASRDPAALKKAADHAKSIPSLAHIPKFQMNTKHIPTDNRPVLEDWGLPADQIAFALSFIFLLFAAAWWRKKTRKEPSARSFPYFAFFTLGFVYIFAEFSIVLKHARFFRGPALGVVLLTASFMAGNFIANYSFVWLSRLSLIKLKILVAFAAFAAMGALIAAAGGAAADPAEAAALALLAGVGCGFLWPFFIRAHPGADLRAAYGVETLGCMLGSFVFNTHFLHFGFRQVANVACTGVFALLCYVILRIRERPVRS